MPFEHLFVPLVLDAREELLRTINAGVHGLLKPEAHAGWERYLLVRLTTAGAKAALLQFQVFKTVRTAFPHYRTPVQNQTVAFYLDFIGERPRDRLQQLFGEFPLLERLCSFLTANWLSTVSEFLLRLDADRRGLMAHFSVNHFTFPITTVEAGLSDPHHGGRCAVRMIFENGASCFYKPRSIAPEAHFAALLEELNNGGIPHRIRSAKCWDRGKYGWMENILTRPCAAVADVHNFYWRAGALLGLVYLANGVDFHRDNLIADGQHPVLIDLEALWHPQQSDGSQPTADQDSVLRTGFLPHGDPKSGGVYELGALSRKVRAEHTVTTWSNINHDEMALETARQYFPRQSNVPFLADEPCLATDYVADIQTGFRWVGETLLGNEGRRDGFLRWLRGLQKCTRRLILHPTAYYQALLERLTQPQCLRLNRIADALAGFPQEVAPELDRELQALEQFDIPYFEQDGNESLSQVRRTSFNLSKDTYFIQAFRIESSFQTKPRM